jgi:hypothetical protein
MSIDGATRIDEVDTTAWDALAKETGYSARFIRASTDSMIERAVEEAGRLRAQPWHDNSTVATIYERLYARGTA